MAEYKPKEHLLKKKFHGVIAGKPVVKLWGEMTKRQVASLYEDSSIETRNRCFDEVEVEKQKPSNGRTKEQSAADDTAKK